MRVRVRRSTLITRLATKRNRDPAGGGVGAHRDGWRPEVTDTARWLAGVMSSYSSPSYAATESDHILPHKLYRKFEHTLPALQLFP